MALEARSDFAVLAALDELGPLSQAEIGRSLGLDRANVNRIVTRLEREGLLRRTQDPHDGRRLMLTATDETITMPAAADSPPMKATTVSSSCLPAMGSASMNMSWSTVPSGKSSSPPAAIGTTNRLMAMR